MKKATALRGDRAHIGILGRRNVGKSSLVNALVRQDVAIVSETPGTTTDPVAKPMELQPVGPVVFIDTAGFDDVGDLGGLRAERTRRMLDRLDLALLVTGADGWGDEERCMLAEMQGRRVPVVVVFNRSDQVPAPAELMDRVRACGAAAVATSAVTGAGLDDLRAVIVAGLQTEGETGPPLVRDLVPAGGTAVLVVPVDEEAPVGRLIMPQVQAIRDLLDGDAACLVVKETGLASALASLREPPALVVTDSQAFAQVAPLVPAAVPLTGFSVLMARFRGDLRLQAEGAAAAARLGPGARVLVAEACTHHPVEDDIGREKIPRWLTAHVGAPLEFTTVQGHDFPADLAEYDLVIHCGGCTLNRREVRTRLERCRRAGVPVTNYG
ncbi:[FeFe] hydrogenase H-cluster maturation GTPase HydF, partial [bacterium]|nr:[FeFe] hydrogenase H-cluster maturation GTPase HydF [bacterium]